MSRRLLFRVPPGGPGGNIACVGDSVTYGNVTGPATAWPTYLSRHLRGRCTAYNRASNGRKLSGTGGILAERVAETGETYCDDLIGGEPFRNSMPAITCGVVLLAGHNDLYGVSPRTGVQLLADTTTFALDSLSLGWDWVLLVKIFRRPDGDVNYEPSRLESNAGIDALAASNPRIFSSSACDNADFDSPSDDSFSDGLHLNPDVGAPRLGLLIAQDISALLDTIGAAS